jgi:hypothetical protein
MTRNVLLIALAIVVLILGSGYLFNRFFPVFPEDVGAELERAAKAPERVSLEDAATEPPPPAPLELPVLAQSDELVRRLVGELSSHPELAAWLVHEDLAKLLVKTVDNIAHGESPRPHLAFLAPEGGFGVTRHDGGIFASKTSYRRYDLVTAVVASLDTAGSVRLYRDLYPLFEEAYGELGNPGRFEESLLAAIDRLLEVPIGEGEIKLKRRVTDYRFADSELEKLGQVEKHLLRMGAHNAREVQAKLRALKTALALTRSEG